MKKKKEERIQMRKPGKTALVIIVTFMMLSINTRARSSVAVSDRPIIA